MFLQKALNANSLSGILSGVENKPKSSLKTAYIEEKKINKKTNAQVAVGISKSVFE